MHRRRSPAARLGRQRTARRLCGVGRRRRGARPKRSAGPRAGAAGRADCRLPTLRQGKGREEEEKCGGAPHQGGWTGCDPPISVLQRPACPARPTCPACLSVWPFALSASPPLGSPTARPLSVRDRPRRRGSPRDSGEGTRDMADKGPSATNGANPIPTPASQVRVKYQCGGTWSSLDGAASPPARGSARLTGAASSSPVRSSRKPGRRPVPPFRRASLLPRRP